MACGLISRWVLLAVALLAVPAVARAQPLEEGPARLCLALMPGFDPAPLALRVETQLGGWDEPAVVRLTWTRAEPGHHAPHGQVVCWFLPRGQTGGAWQIQFVESDAFGRLSRYDVQQLLKFIQHAEAASPAAAGGDPATRQVLHLAQQLINAVSLAALYGLVAVGFTLAFAVSGVFNLALGAIFTIGAFQAFLAWVPGARWLGEGSVWLLPGFLLLSLLGGAAASWACERLAFRPLGPVMGGPVVNSPRGRQASLVVATGLLIALHEGLRLLQGPKTRWLPYQEGGGWTLIEEPGFPLVLSRGHLLVILVTLLLVWGLSRLLRRSRLGLSLRAVAEDPGAAALLGVSLPRVVGLAFLLSGGLAGVAGGFAFLHYGAVNPQLGLLLGFKALAAAILGGIGSPGGALLGGLLIAGVETAAVALNLSAWKEVLVFLLLVLVLALRPAGLAGEGADGR